MIIMLSIIKYNRFLFWFLLALFIFGSRALHYYVNGQSIASAHMDIHYYAYQLNVFVAVILTAILFIMLIVKRRKETLKYFSIPASIIALVPIHNHIGTLFYCCPCCCTERYIHQWIFVSIAALTIIFIAIILLLMLHQLFWRKP